MTPERSLAQRMTALEHANEIRMKRAALKRDLKAGRKDIALILLDPPEYLLTAKVFDVLMAAPKYGRVKVNRLLMLCSISPSRTIGGITPRQRTVLVAMLNPKRRPGSDAPVTRGSTSLTQVMRALAVANTTRLDRADLKRRVAAGEKTVADVLAERPVEAESMPLSSLLAAQNRWGTTRTRRFLASIPIIEGKPIGTLTARQRGEIVRRLEYPEWQPT